MLQRAKRVTGTESRYMLRDAIVLSISPHFYFPNVDDPPLCRLIIVSRDAPDTRGAQSDPALTEFTRHHEGVGQRIAQHYGAIAAEPSSAIQIFSTVFVFL
jgi:hypothetical protein